LSSFVRFMLLMERGLQQSPMRTFAQSPRTLQRRSGRSRVCALAAAIAVASQMVCNAHEEATSRAFAGAGGGRASKLALVGLRPARTMCKGIFDDLQSSLTDKAVQAASGMTAEESEALMEKCKKGNINLDDYLTLMKMFSKLGEVRDAVAPLANMLKNQAGADEDIENAKSQLGEKEALVAALSEEERANPDVFFESGTAGRKAIRRWAEAAKKTDQEILDFMLEYRTIKSMFSRIQSGEDFADVQRELKMDAEELKSTLKSRKARRASKGKSAKKGGGKQPEWMTL